jgi:hypothetical protein
MGNGDGPTERLRHHGITETETVSNIVEAQNCNTGRVPRTGDNVHIPLKTDEALRLALKVKPTNDMPRPGAAKKAAKKMRPRKRT